MSRGRQAYPPLSHGTYLPPISSTTAAVQNDTPSSFEHNADGSSRGGAEIGRHATPPDSAALTAPVDCHAANAIATASAQSESRPRMRFDSDASNDELDLDARVLYIDRLTSQGSVDMDTLIRFNSGGGWSI